MSRTVKSKSFYGSKYCQVVEELQRLLSTVPATLANSSAVGKWGCELGCAVKLDQLNFVIGADSTRNRRAVDSLGFGDEDWRGHGVELGDLDAIKNGGSELLILVSTNRNDLLENVTFLNYLSKRVSSDTVKMSENRRKLKKSGRLKEDLIDSGVGWVFPTPAESSPVTEFGWPSFTPQPSLQPHLPTTEELACVAGYRAQQQGLKAMYEDDDDMEVEKGEKNLNFFAKLFEEDGGLREYYEKNNENGGEFICLVCSGVGKKGWSKRFKDCVGLVQYSITISNMRQTHRAYGQFICRILGWDINRLPSIVLSAGGKPSESSDKPVEDQVLGFELQTSSLANSNDGSNKTLQGNEDAGGKDCLSGLSNTTDAVNVGTDELSQQKQSFSNENQQENSGGSTALEHNSLIEANVSNEIPETAKENTEGASNCPGNECDGGKFSLSDISNTKDTVNIGSSELSQQNRSSSNENQPENGGFSTTLEHKSTSEANANEDVSNDIPETAKENAEGASNCLEPLPDDMIVANEENNDVSSEES
ncbi:uncharacterized protein LOC125865333 [Solanum stenotomum]|uniref:uncharacterized protein LOC125865333 n=1 Tax=Solanum stenotomum TaxID=172797 RepID=UPI0020CFEBDF|nr:uncharacterized protein LOC125865333 [Solanum stenotomum]